MKEFLGSWWNRWGGYLLGIGCAALILPFFIVAVLLYTEHLGTSSEATLISPDKKHVAVLYNMENDPLDGPVWRYEIRGRWPWEPTTTIGKCYATFTRPPRLIRWLDNNHLEMEAIYTVDGREDRFQVVTVDIRSPKFACH